MCRVPKLLNNFNFRWLGRIGRDVALKYLPVSSTILNTDVEACGTFEIITTLEFLQHHFS
jgi:hypothetical protein